MVEHEFISDLLNTCISNKVLMAHSHTPLVNILTRTAFVHNSRCEELQQIPYGLQSLKCLSLAYLQTSLLTWSTKYNGYKVRDTATKARCPCRPVSHSHLPCRGLPSFGCPGSSVPIPALDRDQRPLCSFAHQARSFWNTCG